MKNIINVDKRVKRENDLLFGHIQLIRNTRPQ